MIDAHRCEKCDCRTLNPENDYGEFICADCEQNAAEAAYERHCEDFHDGGCTRFNSLEQQMAEARRLK
jgi:ribosomal protein L37AE/L43A